MGDRTKDHDRVNAAIQIIQDEVFELEKQKNDLLARVRTLQDTIARKHALAGNLENLLVPVNRLPDEILLTCFGLAVQDWLGEIDGADEQRVLDALNKGWPEPNWMNDKSATEGFELPISPAFAISSVSHRWRQLTINMPSLWTNLVIPPKFAHHMDVYRDVLSRVKDMPISANFRFFSPAEMLLAAGPSLMQALMPLMHAQKITALILLSPSPVLSSLLSLLDNQPINVACFPSPYLNVFSRLTVLSIFGIEESHSFTLSQLRWLLSATPQLKTLKLHHDEPPIDPENEAGSTVISLPKLEKLTIIQYSSFIYEFLRSLSAPNLSRVELLTWDANMECDLSYLFINNSDTLLPRFPNVRNLTFSWYYEHDGLDADLIRAFPRVTHLTILSPLPFYDDAGPRSSAPPKFRWLQHLTLNFAFEKTEMDPWDSFFWLPGPEDQADHPLIISVFDSSSLPERDFENSHLLRYYEELQRYNPVFDRRSSRLDEFMRWQADGEQELV
ncbi:hypothetical protein BJ138DRAFT_1152016 [Hygrophoropsis aurantiaca]|uniref:Uncharacterized protein n=1 Tax=Hygrophoropsis aurantiaca TaxID=72124 RepID=A0ACB8ABM3_9AGAM|nr:hypothetical protein BJ138DRAFT_1152016 [Hygrophoropsis aurantiaca]